MAEKKGSVTDAVERLAREIAQPMGLGIWDVEFHKEGSDWYLKILIDRPEGVSINDCEEFSRAIDGPLDQLDPIEQSYYLEVSSAGLERALKKDAHFEASIGKLVRVRFYKPEEGKKEAEGILESFADGIVTLRCEDGSALQFGREKASAINWKVDF